jgi:hypothetical protein
MVEVGGSRRLHQYSKKTVLWTVFFRLRFRRRGSNPRDAGDFREFGEHRSPPEIRLALASARLSDSPDQREIAKAISCPPASARTQSTSTEARCHAKQIKNQAPPRARQPPPDVFLASSAMIAPPQARRNHQQCRRTKHHHPECT